MPFSSKFVIVSGPHIEFAKTSTEAANYVKMLLDIGCTNIRVQITPKEERRRQSDKDITKSY